MGIRIFLSAVSDEFRSYREQLRRDLTRHNVEVKIQEDFKAYGCATLEKLDLYIKSCDAVVHIVGDMTGSIAKNPSTEAIRAKYHDLADRLPPLREPNCQISYTQWEAWLALYHSRRLLIAEADKNARRDSTSKPSQLSRELQQAHLARLRKMERYPDFVFTDQNDLAKNILSSVILDLLVTGSAQEPTSAFRLTIGENEPYVQTKGSVYGVRRTLKLKIENQDRTRSLTRCRLQILEIRPQVDSAGPWILKTDFSLAAGDHVFVPIASYGEARDARKFNCADSFITMATENSRPNLNLGPEYILLLRATAIETSYADIQCKTWVDGEGRLRTTEVVGTEAAPTPLQITYFNECNEPSKESLFKRSFAPLPAGNPLRRRVSIHRFFVAVRNASNRTLRNVRLVIESLSGVGPGAILNESCVCDRTGRDSVDISPKGMEYFLIGEGSDDSDDGMFHPAIMPKPEYDALLDRLEAKSHLGFVLQPMDARFPLLRNNGYRLEVSAYADDVLPHRVEFILNARTRLELFLGKTLPVG